MDVMQPEHRRVKISVDIDSTAATKLQQLSLSHPFTRQIDVIFPSSDIFDSLSNLGTRYIKTQVKLADLVDSGGILADFYSQPEKCFTILGTDAHNGDAWCVDPRSLLTLFVTKGTYERLGLVGKRLPFQIHSDYFVIRVPLQKNTESVANRARVNEALKAWDERREREGFGAWNAVYHSNDPTIYKPTFAESHVCEVACQIIKTSDVHIPSPSLRRHPSASASDGRTLSVDDDDAEDWNTEIVALFEWVGMAGLGSQRLRANDRVDPYVALYNPPSSSHVGSITHLSWKGFLDPAFLQSVIDLAISSLKTLQINKPLGPESAKPFIAIIAHACSASPVSYIPPSTPIGDRPTRLARSDGEDTWSLFVTPGSQGTQSIDWALIESLGQYDTRWG